MNATTEKQERGGTNASGRVYGYARVSSRDQNLSRQLDALTAFPVPEAHIYKDKASGKDDFERTGYQRLMRRIRPGDVLVIMSIDRLGRNYTEILNEWRRITQDKQVAMVVLDMPLLDTRTAHGDITGVFLADIVLQLLSYVAQIERENTHKRQAEGIAAARARGVKFGRPRIEHPECFAEIYRAYKAQEIRRVEAAATLGISLRTFDAWCRCEAAAGAAQQIICNQKAISGEKR